MKKINKVKTIFVLLLFFVGMFFTFNVFAQENTDIQSLVAKLQEQIKTLQAQITELQSQLEVVKTELKFNRTLVRGLQGDDIKQLQEFLKTMPDIYPEGLITGYFGPLTEAAVKRFQAKNNIESLGFVGPRTLLKLNELSVPVQSAVSATPALPTEQKAIPAIPAQLPSDTTPTPTPTPITSITQLPSLSPTTTVTPTDTNIINSNTTPTLTPTPKPTPITSITQLPSLSPTTTVTPTDTNIINSNTTPTSNSGNSTLSVKRLFLGQYDNTKYSLTISDSNGIGEFHVEVAGGGCGFYYSGVGCNPGIWGGNGTPSCPMSTSVNSGTFTLAPSDFPLQGYIIDCSSSTKYVISASMPALPSPTTLSPSISAPNNSTLTVQRISPLIYGTVIYDTQYSFVISDPDGIKEFNVASGLSESG